MLWIVAIVVVLVVVVVALMLRYLLTTRSHVNDRGHVGPHRLDDCLTRRGDAQDPVA